MPQCKPWDALATPLLWHAPSPGGSLLLLSRGTSTDRPGCCDAFGKPWPPKQPTIYSPGVEVWTPQGPILGTDKGLNVPTQPLLSCLGFWAGTESCWKTHYWPLKKVMLICFTTPCTTSSWHARTRFTPSMQNWRCVTPWWDTSHQTMM